MAAGGQIELPAARAFLQYLHSAELVRCPAATRQSGDRQYSEGVFVSMVKVFAGGITTH